MNKFLLVLITFYFLSCSGNSNNNITEETNTQALVVEPEVVKLTTQQIDSIKQAQVKQFFGKKLYNKGWMATSHSYPDDINRSSNGVVKYTNPSIEESGLVLKINSDHTCEFTFKPIRYKSIVKKKAHWEYGSENELLLDEDVFAKVEVGNADFPLSEDPFYDYILISKKIQINGNEIALDQRSTNRSHFFIQFEIAKQSGEATNDEEYAYKILNDLSFDYEMLTQYINYYGY